MLCMRLFGSCWGVSSQNRALLEAHYGPASTEADAEDFGEWAEQDDEKDEANGGTVPTNAQAVAKPSHGGSGGLSLASKGITPPTDSTAVPPPAIARPSAPAQARVTRASAAAPQQADEASSNEDFFADMAPTVTKNPVVPPSRTGPSRLALTGQEQSAGGAWDD